MTNIYSTTKLGAPKLQEHNLVHYLMSKYKFFAIVEGCPYNIDDWENILGEYEYMEKHHDVERKYGIINDQDGLLLVADLILEIVANR